MRTARSATTTSTAQPAAREKRRDLGDRSRSASPPCATMRRTEPAAGDRHEAADPDSDRHDVHGLGELLGQRGRGAGGVPAGGPRQRRGDAGEAHERRAAPPVGERRRDRARQRACRRVPEQPHVVAPGRRGQESVDRDAEVRLRRTASRRRPATARSPRPQSSDRRAGKVPPGMIHRPATATRSRARCRRRAAILPGDRQRPTGPGRRGSAGAGGTVSGVDPDTEREGAGRLGWPSASETTCHDTV